MQMGKKGLKNLMKEAQRVQQKLETGDGNSAH